MHYTADSQVIMFHVLNFRCLDHLRNFFNSEFLPIYGTTIQQRIISTTKNKEQYKTSYEFVYKVFGKIITQ